VTSRFDGTTAESWLKELVSIPGYSRISQIDAESVWLNQMAPHKANPEVWARIISAWNDFTVASLEKAYERPLKVWAGYIRKAIEPHERTGRQPGGPGASKKTDYRKGF
jgi:hypothetical protein